ncbi:MAG: ABC transporter substrate-binding protein [Dehalococcoidia bacterium]|nr:ABC transporter substrate-binding protein [Dehalococcoidia bacterium]
MDRLLGLGTTIDRRRLLGGAGAGALGLTTVALIGCSSEGEEGTDVTPSSSATSSASASASATATADPNAPKRGGIALIDAVEPNFGLLVTSVTNVVATMQESMFDRLIRQGANFTPELSAAETYEWNDDFTKLTVKLKPGLEFHDGKPITADTIRETIEWFVSDKSGANQVKQPLSDVATNVIDDHTIEITTPEPRPWLDDTMTLMWIVDVETIDTIADAKVVNGSGPFKFKSYTPQVGYELERFEKYHVAEQPYLDGITAKILPDQSARDLAIQTGDIQWMRNVPFSSVKALTNDDNVSVQIVTPGGMSGVNTIGMVVDHPALADPRVRLAFAYALDVDQIASDWTDGIITEGWRWPWAPGSAGDRAARDAGVADAVSYDPEKAKGLLAEAGYDTGMTLPIQIPSIQDRTVFVQLVQSYLQDIGVNLDIQVMETAAFMDSFRKRELEALYFTPTSSASRMHPATMFNGNIMGQPNVSHVQTEAFSDFRAKVNVLDPHSAEGQANLAEFARLWSQDDPFMLAVVPNGNQVAARSELKNWQTVDDRATIPGEWWLDA